MLEELTGIKDRVEICREHRLSPQVLARWREAFLERASEIFATTRSRGDGRDGVVKPRQMTASDR